MSHEGEMLDFVRKHSFATLVTKCESGPPVGLLQAVHVPLLVEEPRTAREPWRLLGHVAKANPFWKWANENVVLALFQGPHAYVSPNWYLSKNQVPTWNYEAVHVLGLFEIQAERSRSEEILRSGVNTFEEHRSAPWSLDAIPPPLLDRLIDSIVTFQITIQTWEGTRKLSQNKGQEDRASVIRHLEALTPAEGADSGDAKSLARQMRSLPETPSDRDG